MNNLMKFLAQRMSRIGLCAVALFSIASLSNAAVVVNKAAETAIRASFNEVRPDLLINKVESTEIPGLYHVSMQSGLIVYASANGKYFIAGELFEIGAKGIESVAEKKLIPQRKALLSQLKREDMIIFSPKGETKGAIYVFTDVDCGYCQKLHQEVPQLNAAGIEVRYLAYPRSGVNTPTYTKMQSAWCAGDRKAAMDALKTGGFIQPKTCVNPVAAQYQLGMVMGVNGTPAIVLEDGSLIPGYKPFNELIPIALSSE
ncbi:MAG: thiol:disulfide interchange protein DsbC [Zhongshania sp.]